MKKVFDIISTVVLVVVIVFAFLLVGVRLFGLAPYTVLSGSMEPNIPVGSLIYVKSVGAAELAVKDPLTYMLEDGTVVTHRIIEILPDEDDPTVVRYRVKGDANQDADGDPVHIKNVIGKPVFTIPLLGYVAYAVQTPPTSFLIIGALVILILLAFLPDVLDRLLREDKAKDETLPAADESAQDREREQTGENPDQAQNDTQPRE